MKISNEKIYEQIANVIIKQIKSGELEPGHKLPSIQTLSQNYGVSVASVREALNALRMIGLIEIKHGYGTFVKQKEPTFFELQQDDFSRKDIEDLLELRHVVEYATAYYASSRHTEADIKQMKDALKIMEKAVQKGYSGEEGDLKFHLSIAKASHNKLLYELLENISDLMQHTMMETRKMFMYHQQKTQENLYQEHVDILEAILKGDPELASKHMKQHLNDVKETLLKHI
ncbi:FadR family transcriptional regulator [Staphylococcus massiliensis]|uniref:FadR/GntR family transcriptional regulator n=1 Tax=Staphylococcus massiliensis TaxID=555791 RepID=UPI001EDDA6BA|nr:FadR/GntR family transcriptional regulator [Staphylococcus massiliensis]MCG3413231.1 FadR family transcriptional regulator [Staphylococcus massiliensis]